MTSPTHLRGLIERVEAATGPDRELDALIYATTDEAKNFRRIGMRLTYRNIDDRYHDGWVTVRVSKGQGDPYPEDLPRYTASLDAVRTLIDPADEWEITTLYNIARATVGLNRDHQTSWPGHGEHKGGDPVLAFLSAALRSRAISLAEGEADV